MSAKRVIKAIKKYSTFLISSHIDLEGDALGSELALASLLRKLGKRAWIVNASPTPLNYKFLPGIKSISHNLTGPMPEAAFIIDCSNKQRVGRVSTLIKDNLPVINIDHHMGNKNFGRINWVDTRASSTGEMIFHLFKLTQTKLTKADALNIYTAMLTDTGSFRHYNTQDATHQICSGLLKFGIRPAKIYSQIYENNSARDVQIVGKIICRMNFAANNRIAWISIAQAQSKKIKNKPEILDKIIDLAKSINTVLVVLIFSQKDKRFVKLSMRSKSPINVQKIARGFGGGGHKFASGCTIKGNLKHAEQTVLRRVKKELQRYTKYDIRNTI